MNQTKNTGLIHLKRMERREFINKVGTMLTLALLGGLATSLVGTDGEPDDFDSWAGDYRGV